MKNKNLFFFFVFGGAAAIAAKVYAVCPMCTVAVGAGVGFSRWIGIDDAITGLWLGAFLLSLALWTIDWLAKKNIKSWPVKFATLIAYYALAVIPLYYAKIIAHPIDFICSCADDKLLLGIVQGSVAFFFAAKLYEFLKERNRGHAHFPFEKIVMPIVFLLVFSLIFYFLTL
jgi:hypothetical protein